MEKIIGGIELNNPFPASVRQKLLWPCYEFIANAEGLDDFEKNIIEEVVLKLAEINVRDEAEIARCTGLELDLISFMHSRLQQKGWLDDTCGITAEGKAKLGEFAEKHSQDIHIYVDALTGRVLPYWSAVSERNNFHYDGGKWDKKDEENPDKPLFFRYKPYASAGTESDEEQKAYQLWYDDEYNVVPEVDDVTAMLHKLFPKNDSIVVRIDENQSRKKNVCYVLMEIMLPEGNSRTWVCDDGFGNVSAFFSTDFIQNEKDKNFIAGLRTQLQGGTNAVSSAPKLAPEAYPRLAEKLALVQKSIGALSAFVNSPDKDEEVRIARNDALLYMTQMAEWTLFHILHQKAFEYKARAVLADFEKFKGNKGSGHIIGGIAAKNAARLGFELDAESKKALRERYGRLKSAFESTPSLFALADLAVISLHDENWLKTFAKEHPDFLSRLASLNYLRNQSFHSGNMSVASAEIQNAYDELCALLKAGLGVEVNSAHELTFAEKHEFQNERIAAISRMEDALGFALCRLLDDNLICFITDMERRAADEKSLNNAAVLSMYQILETVFVSANECLGDELKSSDWLAKARSCEFAFDGSREFKSLLGTHEERIQSALERKPSSMNAACIAFMTLADERLLRTVKNLWREMLADVSYIAFKRGHGEIPEQVDAERVMAIKAHIIALIKKLAENGFLVQKSVN